MKKPEHTFSALLWSLSKQIIAKVDEHRSKGLLVRIRSLYVKPKIENFVYKEGSSSYQTSFSNIEKEEWHWKDQHDFIQKIIKQFQEYKDCLLEITQKYEATETQSDFWLSRFCQILAYRAIEPLSDKQLVEQITTFINDLEKSPVEWSASVWLKGVWLDDDEYEISKRILIRRPVPADFEGERSFDLMPFLDPFGHQGAPSAIIELSSRAADTIDVQKEIESLLYAFRLFRLGSVVAPKVAFKPKSFLKFGGIVGSGSSSGAAYKYKFGKTDLPSFVNLVATLKPVLPQPFVSLSEKPDSVDISFQRYQDALLQPVYTESRITSGITSLEALFLKPDERMELSHRLSQRVASLLCQFGFTPLETYNNVSRAYEIRSTFIHGSQIDKGQQQSATKLSETILDYARVSLLVFFQLRNKLEKNNLINKLDNSLLEEAAHTKLKDILANDVIVTK